jgi:hypothetical protein
MHARSATPRLSVAIAALAVSASVAASTTACGSAGESAASPVRRACQSAIYTTRIQGQQPTSVNAVIVQRAIFNDLRRAKTYLDRPTKLARFFTFKSPLTVWGAAPVTIHVRAPKDGIRLLYDQRTLEKLGTEAIAFKSLPQDGVFDPCPRKGHKAEIATQYNGGFALVQPLCATIEVSTPDGAKSTRVVPFGVRHCN